MKLEKLVGDRFKERPSDCQIDSHALMTRGGYMKYVANGIYTSYPPLQRVTEKIKRILREEMDAIDCQEVLFPVVMPASLWQESGRYDSIGGEMARLTDRGMNTLVLGMTHEEAAVQLVREYGQSYTKYPIIIYQIQTKFRDEARPRGGLIRTREFTMKDAYSFHTSQADLEVFYKKCFDAYNRIFARVGIPEVVTVQSDSGIMGGNLSHEYILMTPVGEDTIAVCSNCDYRANMEAAENIVENQRDAAAQKMTLVHTPGTSTIEKVAEFLKVPVQKTAKAVVYQKNVSDEYVILFIRGDLDANETKIKNYLGCEIHPALITEESGIVAGFIGPVGMAKKHTLLFDRSLENTNNMVCGANKPGHHYTGFDIERDFGKVIYRDYAKIISGGICPKCGKKAITVSRGIEVGNIFQLGTKYTKSMGMTYLDKDGAAQYPIMGSYGIGVGRLAASVCEARHDDYGPLWPITIAPWQVHICALRSDEPDVKSYSDALYRELQANGAEVIYDDRPLSAGVMFSDADLLGAPIRAVVSPRNLKEGIVEITARDKSFSLKIPLANAAQTVLQKIAELEREIAGKIK